MKNQLLILLTLLAVLIVPHFSAAAESAYVPRLDFKAKFEPIGNMILHGAGQDAEAFENYVQATGRSPALRGAIS